MRVRAPQMKTGQIGGEVLFSSGGEKRITRALGSHACPPPRAPAVGTPATQSLHA